MERNVRRMSSYLLSPLLQNKFLIAVYLFLSLLGSIVEVGLAYAMSISIEYAMAGSLEDLPQYLLLFVLYILLGAIVGYAGARTRFKILSLVMADVKQTLHEHIMSFSLQQFQAENSASYIADLTVHMETIRSSWYNTILSLCPCILKFVISTIAMFVLSPVLGLYVIVLALIQTSIPYFFTKKIAEKGEAVASAQEAHLVTIKENLSSFTTSRLFHIADHLNRRQADQCRAYENAWYKAKTFNRFTYELSFSVGNAVYLGIFLLGALLVILGHLKLSSIIAASQLMVYIASPLTTISSDLAELQSASRVAASLDELRKLPTTPDGTSSKARFNTCIQLHDVSFSHGEHPVIVSANYIFDKGKKYLIVGESGSGKSTFLHLIAGLYHCDAGTITMDGMDIRDINRADFCKMVSCIPQEPFLFDDTIAENVRLFRDVTDQEIMDALYKAGLESYIHRLPNGIHTNIGENAAQMSGGEKQRLSIARALVGRCAVLLMDESTSHLDPATATEIERLVFGLQDVTVLFVTHQLRQETQAYAHETILIENGCLNPVEVKNESI